MRPIGGLLQYFEESGSDNNTTYYDIKDGFSAEYDEWLNVDVIGISNNTNDHQIYGSFGDRIISLERITTKIKIHRLVQVY